MDKEDTITFHQTDLSSVSFSLFQDMRKEEQLCDVRISVQNHSFTAHRLVLAAAIPYFRSLFISADKEVKEKEIAVEDLNPLALEALINFAYTSEVTISMENVESLIDASHFLQLCQVRDSCVEFLSERLQVSTVFQVRSLGLRLTGCNLVEIANTYIRKNFEEFVKCDSFLSLPVTCMKEIISADSLNVGNEEIVFESVIRWVMNSEQERESLLPELLSEVRLTLLPVEYLVDRVDSEELIKSSKTCRDLLNDVKNYHLLSKKRTFLNLKTHPRSNKFSELYVVCLSGCSTFFVYRFDAVKNVWHNLANRKINYATAVSAVSVGDRIYMFYADTVMTFDLVAHEWKMLETECPGSYGSAIVSYKDLIFLFGANDEVLRNRVRCFDIEKNKWQTEKIMKRERWDSSAALLEDFIYLTGGYDGENSSNTVEKYNPSSGEFTDVAPMFIRRYQHGCTALNEKIYVCGGTTEDDYEFNTAERYDPLIDQWKFLRSATNFHYISSMVSHNDKIYAFGKSDVEIYNEVDDLWGRNLGAPEDIECALSISYVKY